MHLPREAVPCPGARPASSCPCLPWSAPGYCPPPWPDVQLQELFLLVANAPQQRGCPRDQSCVVSLDPRDPMQISMLSWSPSPDIPFTSLTLGAWPNEQRPRLIVATPPLQANQEPESQRSVEKADTPRVGPSGSSPLLGNRSLVWVWESRYWDSNPEPEPNSEPIGACSSPSPIVAASLPTGDLTLHQEPNRNRAAGIRSNLQTRLNQCIEILSFKFFI